MSTMSTRVYRSQLTHRSICAGYPWCTSFRLPWVKWPREGNWMRFLAEVLKPSLYQERSREDGGSSSSISQSLWNLDSFTIRVERDRRDFWATARAGWDILEYTYRIAFVCAGIFHVQAGGWDGSALELCRVLCSLGFGRQTYFFGGERNESLRVMLDLMCWLIPVLVLWRVMYPYYYSRCTCASGRPKSYLLKKRIYAVTWYYHAVMDLV